MKKLFKLSLLLVIFTSSFTVRAADNRAAAWAKQRAATVLKFDKLEHDVRKAAGECADTIAACDSALYEGNELMKQRYTVQEKLAGTPFWSFSARRELNQQLQSLQENKTYFSKKFNRLSEQRHYRLLHLENVAKRTGCQDVVDAAAVFAVTIGSSSPDQLIQKPERFRKNDQSLLDTFRQCKTKAIIAEKEKIFATQAQPRSE